MDKLQATQQESGQRLDLFITLKLPKYSRSNVRSALDAGKVVVNGEVEYRPNYKVRSDDVVEVEKMDDMQRKHLPLYEFKLKIVYQDENIVVVDKPSGLSVHPTSLKDNKTLLNALYYQLSDSIRDYGVNLVNRIDKGTSGLVVAAISPRGAWYYSRLFAEGRVRKEYKAAVGGGWKRIHGDRKVEVSNMLEYDHVEKKQQKVLHTKGGSYAHTEFYLLDQKHDSALIKALPHTGRTHQIRAHLAELGFPIIGDKRYGGREAKRLMLHSYLLEMQGEDGKKIKVEAELPKDFIY